MLATGILSSLLLLVAAILFIRELRFYQQRNEYESQIFVYTRKRFIRRSIGLASLALLGIMLYLGLHIIDFIGHHTLFLIFWGVFVVLIIIIFIIPALDFRETYRYIVPPDSSGRLKELIRINLEQLEEEKNKDRTTHD